MSRVRYLWDREAREWVPAHHLRAKKAANAGPMVMRDIDPYRSVIDGSVIGSRRQHRDHLRAHGCIEVGNEWVEPRRNYDIGPVAHDIKRALGE
jgi:hypothetical protein